MLFCNDVALDVDEAEADVVLDVADTATAAVGSEVDVMTTVTGVSDVEPSTDAD